MVGYLTVFGPWIDPLLDIPVVHVDVPAGQPCYFCETLIHPTHSGRYRIKFTGEAPAHYECLELWLYPYPENEYELSPDMHFRLAQQRWKERRYMEIPRG